MPRNIAPFSSATLNHAVHANTPPATATPPVAHPTDRPVVVPANAIVGPLEGLLRVPERCNKVSNFVSRGRSAPGSTTTLRHFRTQEELALAARFESQLHSTDGVDFANLIAQYFGVQVNPETKRAIRDAIPLYSVQLVPANGVKEVFRGVGLTPALVGEILAQPTGIASRRFAHSLLHGFQNADGTYRLGHGIASVSTLTGVAKNFAAKESKPERGLQPVLMHLSLFGDRGELAGARGVAFAISTLPQETHSEHEIVLDVTNRYEITGTSTDAKNRLVVHISAFGKAAADRSRLVATDNWPQVGKQAGSNKGGRFVDGIGTEWYVKSSQSEDFSRNEWLAAELYRAANVLVPQLAMVTRGNQPAIASRIMGKLRTNPAALQSGKVPGAHSGFAADVWLANWDVVGLEYDNLLLDAAGRAVRVDVGGSLIFRAMGGLKGDRFDDEASELLSMLDQQINPQAASVFDSLNLEQLKQGIRAIERIPDQQIANLCARGPGDPAQRLALTRRLIMRKRRLVQELERGLPHFHPRKNDDGKLVIIRNPGVPSAAQAWRAPAPVLTCTPGAALPESLNGIALKPSFAPNSANAWTLLHAIAERIDEPAFQPHPEKSSAVGTIVIEHDGRIWLIEPTNHIGDYQQTFPKGVADSTLSMQTNAVKKTREKTGLRVELTAFLGDFDRSSSRTRYYLAMRKSGTPCDMGWETQSVKLATPDAAPALLNQSIDRKILGAVGKHVHPARNDEGHVVIIKKPSVPSKPADWAKPGAMLAFTPSGATPAILNKTPFRPVQAPSGDAWRNFGNTGHFDEPAFDARGMKPAAGVVILEADGRIWLTEPTNHHGRYEHSFPKGRLDANLSMRQSAIKEAYEETGLVVELTGFLDDVNRTTSRTRFYVGKRIGGTPAATGWESQSLKLALLADAERLLNMPIDKYLLGKLTNRIHPSPKSAGIYAVIDHPSEPTSGAQWWRPDATVVVVPGSRQTMPAELHGIGFGAVQAPRDAHGWKRFATRLTGKFNEPAFAQSAGRKSGAGAIVIEKDGRVWVVEPTNHFGDYHQTFPKGQCEPTLDFRETAIKEVFEETGLHVELTGYLGDYQRDTSKTRYYIAKRVGGTPVQMSWESQSVRLAPLTALADLLNRDVDRSILADLTRLFHPRKDERGNRVLINTPTLPSAATSWADPQRTATFVPDGKVPATLNGIALQRWSAPATASGWAALNVASSQLREPSFTPKPGLRSGAGVVICEPDGRIWFTEPTNHFGNYTLLFPKGEADRESGSFAQNAAREAFEETGLRVQIIGFVGDFDRDTSRARYYLARRTGGTPADMGWESQSVKLMPPEAASTALDQPDRPVDKAILKRALTHFHTDGREVAFISNPVRPSAPDTWSNASASAVFVPRGALPPSLNGTPLSSWTAPTDATGWRHAARSSVTFAEPRFQSVPNKDDASGAIVVEPDGRIWTVEPLDHAGGYDHTLPKGKRAPELSPAENAVRRTYEKTGLHIELTDLLGDFERSTSKARFYLARRIGGTPRDMGIQSQSVRLMPLSAARVSLSASIDKKILERLIRVLGPQHGITGGWPLAPSLPADAKRRVVSLQASIRGALQRRKVRVRQKDDVVSVDIHGDKKLFASLGFAHLHTTFPKTMHYMAVDPNAFEANLVGGDSRRYPVQKPDGVNTQALFGGTHLETSPLHALTNGTFYNHNDDADRGQRQSAAIGEAKYLKVSRPSVTIDPQYADEYAKVDFGSTSFHSGPILSENGMRKFREDKLAEMRFQYGESVSRPGGLHHANHPNPRTALSMPYGIGRGMNTYEAPPAVGHPKPDDSAHWDAVRMVSVTAKVRGAQGDGATLPELSAIMARIERFNKTWHSRALPWSINLDGGRSVYSAVIYRDGRKDEMPLPSGNQGVPNFVALSRKSG
ncbi:NUDIX hydrolase [Paraburkholderia sp. Ac-20336]|uniref:NUDIX hydrolase n=1 Tax=Burkholderiaceae TaxID=119060 RepID=UPI001422EFA7|nr:MULTISPECIES: NUDIX hydrolase [Burkholderiaceae]MBN3804816.1 NUDIX hydrolase [Paraburkholderia sp. Ac-20336]MBN3845956.1 NUDIX hydrolase [Paraburkholderia sp. Ac-20342]NIF54097.1 NUDIX hydrolase [Burkholderia sp. Ax-1724]